MLSDVKIDNLKSEQKITRRNALFTHLNRLLSAVNSRDRLMTVAWVKREIIHPLRTGQEKLECSGVCCVAGELVNQLITCWFLLR